VAFVLRACKESIPIPQQHNTPFMAGLVSSVGFAASVIGSLSVWFGWALWASLRYYPASGQPGWCLLFVVLGFVFGGISALVFSIERTGEYALLPDAAHVNSDLNSDWTTPPYRTSMKSFLYFHQWDAPALTSEFRTLLFA
jgi:hypothetical protein